MTSRDIVAPDGDVLCVLLLAALTGSPARVHVDAGELGAPIVEELTAELPGSIATSTAGADLLLSVERKADELEVTIRDQLGRPVLTRTVSLVDGLTPALRRIVLVVANAVENAETTTEVTPPPPAVRGLAISVSAAFAFEWWTTMSEPQIGATIAVLFDPGLFDFGLRVTFVGEPCCRRTERGISADARELDVLLEAGYRALELGDDAALRVHAGLGVGWISLEVRPDAFQGSAPTQPKDAINPLAELGATFTFEVLRDRLSLQGSAGIDVRPQRKAPALPEGYVAGSLDPGLFNPWIRAGITVDFF